MRTWEAFSRKATPSTPWSRCSIPQWSLGDHQERPGRIGCFEAVVALKNACDERRVYQPAGEARALMPAGDDTQVRRLIAYYKSKPAAALDLLPTMGHREILNLRAALFIEPGRSKGARPSWRLTPRHPHPTLTRSACGRCSGLYGRILIRRDWRSTTPWILRRVRSDLELAILVAYTETASGEANPASWLTLTRSPHRARPQRPEPGSGARRVHLRAFQATGRRRRPDGRRRASRVLCPAPAYRRRDGCTLPRG